MLQHEDIPWRINVFAGQVFSACGMRGWCFGSEREFYFTTSAHQNELLTMLRISGCLDYAYDHFKDSNRPFILSDSVGLLWLGEFSYLDNAPRLLFIMGPVFMSQATAKGIESALTGMNMSVAMRSGMVQILQSIPVVPLAMLTQYALMLHFTIDRKSVV